MILMIKTNSTSNDMKTMKMTTKAATMIMIIMMMMITTFD